MDFTRACFGQKNEYASEMKLPKNYEEKNVQEKYEHIKVIYGEIHGFYIRTQKNAMDREDIEKLDLLISSIRNTMYAAKSLKDAIPDIKQLSDSSNDVKYHFYTETASTTDKFIDRLYELVNEEPKPDIKHLVSLFRDVTKEYDQVLKELYKEGTAGKVNETDITTLLNFNREIFTAFKSFIFAVKNYAFDKDEAKEFDELPGFIR
jgi:phosphate:Na+ symporter